MKSSHKMLIVLVGLAATLLAACQKSGGAAGAVEAYLRALAAKQPETLATLSCAAWEPDALIEASSFAGVGVTLDGLQCQESGADGNYSLVACQGKIIADYNGEAQEFALDRRVYRAILEGGEWRMCGYQSAAAMSTVDRRPTTVVASPTSSPSTPPASPTADRRPTITPSVTPTPSTTLTEVFATTLTPTSTIPPTIPPTPTLIPGSAPRLPPTNVYFIAHGDREKPYVALTFDLCQRPDLPAGFDAQIVNVLETYNARATFFLGGDWMRTHIPETRLLAANPLFELGNHSWSHPDMTDISETQMSNEILRTQDMMYQITGRQPQLFRLPGGLHDDEVLGVVASLGLVTIQWDADTADPVPDNSAENIVKLVTERVQNGSIVLMHANGRGWHTAEALPGMIEYLRGQGYCLVTVSQLIGLERIPVDCKP